MSYAMSPDLNFSLFRFPQAPPLCPIIYFFRPSANLLKVIWGSLTWFSQVSTLWEAGCDYRNGRRCQRLHLPTKPSNTPPWCCLQYIPLPPSLIPPSAHFFLCRFTNRSSLPACQRHPRQQRKRKRSWVGEVCRVSARNVHRNIEINICRF